MPHTWVLRSRNSGKFMRGTFDTMRCGWHTYVKAIVEFLQLCTYSRDVIFGGGSVRQRLEVLFDRFYTSDMCSDLRGIV